MGSFRFAVANRFAALGVLWAAFLLSGCEGTLTAELGDGLTVREPILVADGSVRPIPGRDSGPPATTTDGGPGPGPNPMPGTDAGTPNAPYDAGAPPSGSPCGDPTVQAVLALTNEARAAEGRGPLACDDDATRAARAHSQDMCDQGYFSHTSLDGRTFGDRLREHGVSFRTGGENIARGQSTPDSVHQAWMNSPGHRQNILSSSYGRIGIGYVACPGAGPYWTQNFVD